MIVPIRDQYLEGAKVAHTELVVLPKEEAEQLRSQVAERFARSQVSWLWERFVDAVAIQDDKSWKWVDDYIAGSETIIFFNKFDDSTIFVLPAGSRLVPILRETYLSEFYLTNSRADYLLCYNHHGYLIANWNRARMAQSAHSEYAFAE